jgi:hypothetical protein
MVLKNKYLMKIEFPFFSLKESVNSLINTAKNNLAHYLVIKYIIVNLQTLFERGMFNN